MVLVSDDRCFSGESQPRSNVRTRCASNRRVGELRFVAERLPFSPEPAPDSGIYRVGSVGSVERHGVGWGGLGWGSRGRAERGGVGSVAQGRLSSPGASSRRPTPHMRGPAAPPGARTPRSPSKRPRGSSSRSYRAAAETWSARFVARARARARAGAQLHSSRFT